MAGSSVIGALRVTLGADTAAFDKGLDRTRGRLSQFDRDTRKISSNLSGFGRDLGASFGPVGMVLDKIGAAGLVAGAGVGAAAIAFQGMRNALKVGDDLDAVSTKLGTTAERLQELTYAAHENDITTDALTTSLEGLNVALGAYKSGVGDAKIKKAFEALGLTRADVAGAQSAADLLPVLADRIAKVQTTAERVKLLQALGAADLEPVLNQGSAALENMSEKARSLGMVMSNDLAKKTADANRELERMGEVLNGNLTIGFAGAALAAEQAISRFKPLLDWLRQFNAESKKLQAEEGKRKGAEFRAKAAAIEARGGPNETSKTYRAMADRWDPQEFNMGSAQEYAAMQRDLETFRPPASTTTTTTGGGGRARSGRAPGSQQPESYAGKTVAVISLDPESRDILDQLVYWREVEARANSAAIIDQNPEGFQSSADRIAEALKPSEAAFADMQASFRDAFSGGLTAALRGGEEGFKSWIAQGAERGLEEALNNLADLLFKLFSQAKGGNTGTAGMGGGGVGDILSAVFGSGGMKIPGFATEGGFTMGGSGGVDSKLAMFRMTPGEMVDVHHGKSSRGETVNNFDLRGAVVTERLYQEMQAIAAQGDAQVMGRVSKASADQAKASRYRVAR